jgi:Ca-activated chloride channel family protein
MVEAPAVMLARPWGLSGGLLVVAVALAATAHFRWKARVRSAWIDEPLWRRLAGPTAGRHQGLKALMTVAGLTLLTVALAGPRWGVRLRETHRRGSDVIVAVDVSASMLAEDVKPDRLSQAKRELALVLDSLEGDRVGVVAFAGEAFLQCPLTLDTAAAKTLLDAIDPGLIPRPGTNLAAALDTAVKAFPEGPGGKALALLTDGEDHSGVLEAAVRRAAAAEVRVFPIGFGSPDGEVIPVKDETGHVVDFKKDKTGKTVVSKLDEPALRAMATATGGAYARARDGDIDIRRLVEAVRGLPKRDLDSRQWKSREDRAFPFAAAALILFLLEFLWPEDPRRWRKALPFLLLAIAPPAHALGRLPSSQAWSRMEERLARDSDEHPGDAQRALRWGNAAYRAGRFETAARAYGRAETDAGVYNSGNALTRQNKFAEALEKYKQALRRNPEDADARHNLEWVQKLLKQNPSPKDGKGDRAPATPEKKPGDLSPEDAERILQMAAEREKSARGKQPPAKPQPVEQDW